MCNQKTKDGKPCMLSPYKDICHIHQKQQDKILRDLLTKDTKGISEVDLLKNEISEIKIENSKLKDKYKTIKTLYDNMIEEHSDCNIKDNKIINLKISNQDLIIKLENELIKNNKLYKKIENMKSDFDAYQIIKKFERQKKYNIINNIKPNNDFNQLRIIRNKVVHDHK
jgi:uncharacterized protein YktA (UPF0223 family)